MSKVLTSRQVSILYNPGLPEWQHDANEAHIESTWEILKLGGIWGYPRHEAVLKKHPDGWEIVELGDLPRPALGSAEYFAEQEQANREAGE